MHLKEIERKAGQFHLSKIKGDFSGQKNRDAYKSQQMERINTRQQP
jgi:hypothetical protein